MDTPPSIRREINLPTSPSSFSLTTKMANISAILKNMNIKWMYTVGVCHSPRHHRIHIVDVGFFGKRTPLLLKSNVYTRPLHNEDIHTWSIHTTREQNK